MTTPTNLPSSWSPNHNQPQPNIDHSSNHVLPSGTAVRSPNLDHGSSYEQPIIIQSPHHDQSSSHQQHDQGQKRKRGRPRSNTNDVQSHHRSQKQTAINFPAITFSVGSWKRHAKHKGDLTVKLYFARRQLVWEFLDGDLKKRMNVAWSDIIALNATMQHGQQYLLIELGSPPSFGQECDPQPKMHTKWKETSDFTQGQASLHRIYRTTFPPEELDEPLRKLLEFDSRLRELSQKPFPSARFNSHGRVGGLNQATFQSYTPNLAYATTSIPNVPNHSLPINAGMGGSGHHQHTTLVNQNLQQGGVFNPVPNQQICRNNATFHTNVERIQNSRATTHASVNPSVHASLQGIQNSSETIHASMNLNAHAANLQRIQNSGETIHASMNLNAHAANLQRIQNSGETSMNPNAHAANIQRNQNSGETSMNPNAHAANLQRNQNSGETSMNPNAHAANLQRNQNSGETSMNPNAHAANLQRNQNSGEFYDLIASEPAWLRPHILGIAP